MESPKKPGTSDVDPLVLNLDKQCGLLHKVCETQQRLLDLQNQELKKHERAITDLQNRYDKLQYKLDWMYAKQETKNGHESESQRSGVCCETAKGTQQSDFANPQGSSKSESHRE